VTDRHPHVPDDPTLLALEELVRAAEEMRGATALVIARAAVIRRSRQQGLPYREIVHSGDGPLIAELLTDSIRRYQAAGTRFRYAEARALQAEGLTLEQIGQLFGLTRQRIAAILRRQPTPPGGTGS
jgi:hypothetical protein